LHLGAPRANATFFCDSQSVNCWTLIATNMTQQMASGACSSMAGELIAYPSAEKQRMVEVRLLRLLCSLLVVAR
jgi:hypothetical protein